MPKTSKIDILWRSIDDKTSPQTTMSIDLKFAGKTRTPNLFGPNSFNNPVIAVRGETVAITQICNLRKIPINKENSLNGEQVHEELANKLTGIQFMKNTIEPVAGDIVRYKTSMARAVTSAKFIFQDSQSNNPSGPIEMEIRRKF